MHNPHDSNVDMLCHFIQQSNIVLCDEVAASRASLQAGDLTRQTEEGNAYKTKTVWTSCDGCKQFRPNEGWMRGNHKMIHNCSHSLIYRKLFGKDSWVYAFFFT